jgi:peptide/nickel transport system permease protein
VSALASTRGRLAAARGQLAGRRAGQVAAALLAVLVLVALLGPLVAPYGPAEIVGVPFSGPTGSHPLGTDYLGHDVLSRLLCGGRSVILYALLATVTAYTVGGLAGLLAGLRGGLVDAVLMRAVDVILAFPAVLLLLVLAAGSGGSVAILVAGVALVNVPGIARVVRAATAEVATKAYVEAAVARGARTPAIVRRDVLPNIASIVAADAGTRFAVSILLAASMNFLGVGIEPPAADWAVMITENRSGLTLQPWALAAPALLLAALTVSVSVVADVMTRERRSVRK